MRSRRTRKRRGGEPFRKKRRQRRSRKRRQRRSRKRRQRRSRKRRQRRSRKRINQRGGAHEWLTRIPSGLVPVSKVIAAGDWVGASDAQKTAKIDEIKDTIDTLVGGADGHTDEYGGLIKVMLNTALRPEGLGGLRNCIVLNVESDNIDVYRIYSGDYAKYGPWWSLTPPPPTRLSFLYEMQVCPSWAGLTSGGDNIRNGVKCKLRSRVPECTRRVGALKGLSTDGYAFNLPATAGGGTANPDGWTGVGRVDAPRNRKQFILIGQGQSLSRAQCTGGLVAGEGVGGADAAGRDAQGLEMSTLELPVQVFVQEESYDVDAGAVGAAEGGYAPPPVQLGSVAGTRRWPCTLRKMQCCSSLDVPSPNSMVKDMIENNHMQGFSQAIHGLDFDEGHGPRGEERHRQAQNLGAAPAALQERFNPIAPIVEVDAPGHAVPPRPELPLGYVKRKRHFIWKFMELPYINSSKFYIKYLL